MKPTGRTSRILDEVDETVRGLNGSGLISNIRMNEFAALCQLELQTDASSAVEATAATG